MEATIDDANLTPQEREIVRDFDAYHWGSLDVSLEQLLSKLHELTPEGRKRGGAVIGERVRSSQARELGYERNLEELEPAVERLQRLTRLLEGLMDRLDPPAAD